MKLFWWTFSKNDEKLNEEIRRINFTDYMLIDWIWKLFSMFDSRKYFDENNKKIENTIENINALQKMVSLRERYISDKNEIDRIKLHNEILKHFEYMKTLSYSQDEKNLLQDFIKKLNNENQVKKKENANQLLEKSKYETYLV